MFGAFCYVSVCSVEATLATNEIKFYCERQSPLDIEVVLSITKALVCRLTAFVGIRLPYIRSFDLFDTTTMEAELRRETRNEVEHFIRHPRYFMYPLL